MTATKALQAALAAEHAAVHVYGAVGARTSQTAQPVLFAAVTAAYAQHRARRDSLDARVRELDATPVAAQPAYRLPPLESPDDVRAAARDLEAGTARAYAFVVASTTGDTRAWAATALTDAAVRGLSFGGAPEVLPGLG